MAGGARTDGAVGVRSTDAVALHAPTATADCPSRPIRGFSARLQAPGWYFSEKATWSAVSPFSP